MSLHSTEALIVEGATAAESLPDPTTVSGRTHWLHNNFAGSQVWSSTGATPFVVNGVNSATLTVLRGQTAQLYSDGTRWNVIPVASPAGPQNYPQAYLRATNRISTMDGGASLSGTAFGTVSGTVAFMFFTAPTSLTVSNVRWACSSPAGSSGLASGWGLYSVDASDNGTLLVVKTGNIFTGSGVQTTALAASQALTAGTRYAIGVLHIDGSSPPTLAGFSSSGSDVGSLRAVAPRISGLLAGQASLPASFTGAALANTNNMLYAEVY